jgi:pimeloyl-ACP methyl ester carboxylesterase
MGNLSLNYRVDGQGSPLLMVHGFGISFNIWSSLLSSLRSHFTVIMVELPGIGRSPLSGQAYLEEAVCGLERVREQLGIEKWNVFSYSSGTRVAEKYIQMHPARVERAVFLCPAQISASKAFGLNVVIQLDRYIPQFGNWILSGSRLRFLIDLLGFNLKRNHLSPNWFAEISSQPRGVLKETLRSLPGGGRRPFDIPDDVPALFVWGHKDLITNVPRRRSSRDCMIPATHSAPQTAAQNVSEVVLPFLLPAGGNP